MIDKGGSAFPPYVDGSGDIWEGMTRRDWLAGLAMQGLCCNRIEIQRSLDRSDSKFNSIAKLAYKIADDMIAEG